jgi:hypothetical protein
LATGADNAHPPWVQIGENPSLFFNSECIPNGMKVADPSRMGLKVKNLLNHLRDRQEEHGVKAFYFHHILRNGKLEPAQYPKEAEEAIGIASNLTGPSSKKVKKKKKSEATAPPKLSSEDPTLPMLSSDPVPPMLSSAEASTPITPDPLTLTPTRKQPSNIATEDTLGSWTPSTVDQLDVLNTYSADPRRTAAISSSSTSGGLYHVETHATGSQVLQVPNQYHPFGPNRFMPHPTGLESQGMSAGPITQPPFLPGLINPVTGHPQYDPQQFSHLMAYLGQMATHGPQIGFQPPGQSSTRSGIDPILLPSGEPVFNNPYVTNSIVRSYGESSADPAAAVQIAIQPPSMTPTGSERNKATPRKRKRGHDDSISPIKTPTRPSRIKKTPKKFTDNV